MSVLDQTAPSFRKRAKVTALLVEPILLTYLDTGHSELPLLPERRHDDTTDTTTVYDQSTLIPRIDTTKIELGKLLAKGFFSRFYLNILNDNFKVVTVQCGRRD